MDISSLFALGAAVAALIATFSSVKSARLWRQIEEVLRALSSERGTIDVHASAIEQLRDELRSLRGKFYAERRKSAETPIDPPTESPADLKARLRKQLGLVPGRH